MAVGGSSEQEIEATRFRLVVEDEEAVYYSVGALAETEASFPVLHPNELPKGFLKFLGRVYCTNEQELLRKNTQESS